MSSDVPPLPEPRREIDRIDDAIHDLLMQRTEVVETIGQAKKGNGFLVPSREVQVLRRLIARHRGRLPKAVIVRVWRELFAAWVAMQGNFAVAVYMPKRGAGFLEIARDQYGAYTNTITFTSVSQVIRSVTDGTATVGILPLPHDDGPSSWWHTIVGDAPGTPKIIARLPFTGPGSGRGDGLEAMAVSGTLTDPSDNDRTLVVLETGGGVSRASLRQALTNTGLEKSCYQGHRPLGDDASLHLIEINGNVTGDDTRMRHLMEAEGGPVRRSSFLGGYALPFTAEELAP